MRKHILVTLLCAASLHVAFAECATSEPRTVAINVLLLPDQSMSAHARDLNRQLRTNDPQGFALDETHVPHISLVHQYVRSEDLPRVFEAVQRVVAPRGLIGRELTTKGIEHQAWSGRELSSLAVQKTPELVDVQRELIAALKPYRSEADTARAFIPQERSSGIDAATIDYVATFAEKRTGENFKPHITLGFSDAAFADQLKDKQTKPVRFEIADVAVFQLGNVGTARKELWRLSQH